MSIDTVIFDLDGVIIDTESMWNTVRHEFARAHGGHWGESDQPAVMGANSMEWASSMRDNNGVDLSPEEIYDGIISELKKRYARQLPIMPGAPEAIARLAQDYLLGVASSSPLELVEYALEVGGLRIHFDTVVSSDEVARGKPAPDVYLEVCARLRTSPERAVAVEDSSNGIRAAHAAGLSAIAIPNPEFPPSAEALGLAEVVLDSIAGLTGVLVESVGQTRDKLLGSALE